MINLFKIISLQYYSWTSLKWQYFLKHKMTKICATGLTVKLLRKVLNCGSKTCQVLLLLFWSFIFPLILKSKIICVCVFMCVSDIYTEECSTFLYKALVSTIIFCLSYIHPYHESEKWHITWSQTEQLASQHASAIKHLVHSILVSEILLFPSITFILFSGLF